MRYFHQQHCGIPILVSLVFGALCSCQSPSTKLSEADLAAQKLAAEEFQRERAHAAILSQTLKDAIEKQGEKVIQEARSEVAHLRQTSGATENFGSFRITNGKGSDGTSSYLVENENSQIIFVFNNLQISEKFDLLTGSELRYVFTDKNTVSIPLTKDHVTVEIFPNDDMKTIGALKTYSTNRFSPYF